MTPSVLISSSPSVNRAADSAAAVSAAVIAATAITTVLAAFRINLNAEVAADPTVRKPFDMLAVTDLNRFFSRLLILVNFFEMLSTYSPLRIIRCVLLAIRCALCVLCVLCVLMLNYQKHEVFLAE